MDYKYQGPDIKMLSIETFGGCCVLNKHFYCQTTKRLFSVGDPGGPAHSLLLYTSFSHGVELYYDPVSLSKQCLICRHYAQHQPSVRTHLLTFSHFTKSLLGSFWNNINQSFLENIRELLIVESHRVVL